MKQFKEWVSDYLRYILLLIGALLAFTIITFGVQTWLIIRNGDYVSGETTQNGSGGKGAIEILTESESEPESASEPESESESETEPESETEITQDETSSEVSAETQNETEKQTETSPVTERQTEKKSNSAKPQIPSKPQPESEKKPETQPVTERQTQPVTERETQPPTERETQPVTERQTQPPTETEYVPVYKTLKGSCYIRSGPSYEAEIIGEYMYGTTVEFLEDVGGWYKVQIDGMVGYMGARFF